MFVRNEFPGKIIVFDQRGKCKEVNICAYDTNGFCYNFEWYHSVDADKIWNKFDEYGDYIDYDPAPVQKIINVVNNICPDSITISRTV